MTFSFSAREILTALAAVVLAHVVLDMALSMMLF